MTGGPRELWIWLCGVAVGAVLVWVFADESGPSSAIAPAEAPQPGVPTVEVDDAITLEGRSRFASAVDAHDRAAASVTPGSHRPAFDTAIQVVFTEGAPDQGYVYALPAGASGVDDEGLVAHAYDETGFLIPLVRGGTYDVGCKVGPGFRMVEGVEVANGETRQVEMDLPDVGYIDVRFSKTLADDEAVDLRIARTEGGPETQYLPGRGQAVAWSSSVSYRGAAARDFRMVVPADAEFDVHVNGSRWEGQKRLPFSGLRCVAPKRVQSGDILQITVEQAAEVGLIMRSASYDRGNIAVRLKFVVKQRGHEPATIDTWTSLFPRTAKNPAAGFRLPVAPGVEGTVTWTGNGVAKGHVSFASVPRGARRDVEAVVSPRTDWDDLRAAQYPKDDESAKQAVRLEGLTERDIEWFGVTVIGRFGPHHPSMAGAQSTGDLDDDMLPHPWADAIELGAVCGPFKVAPKIANRAGGEAVLKFVEGGLLVVVPDRAIPEGQGHLRFARADGLPIPAAERGEDELQGASWARSPVSAGPGQILGPFPAGPLTLRVWIGSTRLADIEVTVRAGRLTPLVVRH